MILSILKWISDQQGNLITHARSLCSTKLTGLVSTDLYRVFTHETVFSDIQPAKRIPSMMDIYISTSGVQKLLANLNPSKAAGPDNLSPRILKELSDVLADP